MRLSENHNQDTSFTSNATCGFKRSLRSKIALLIGLSLFASAGIADTLPALRSRKASSIQLRTLGTERGPASDSRDARTAQLICSISVFFSTQPENRFGLTSHLDGRGLLNCRNDQGFTTETPVIADIEASLPASLEGETEIAFSGNTSVFVIPREVSQIQDTYVVRELNSAAGRSSDTATPSVLFRGKRHDLVIEMKLTSQTARMQDIKVKGISFKFDDSAPSLGEVY